MQGWGFTAKAGRQPETKGRRAREPAADKQGLGGWRLHHLLDLLSFWSKNQMKPIWMGMYG
jgi:hypothetical protein